MEESKENFKKIKSANQMMLDYFNKSFLSQLEDIQNLKTQIFEIDIKIDELDKTKDIYAFKTNSRKSVFSPVTNDGVDTERNKIIQEQIKDLQSVKETLTLKLRGMELQLNKLRQYLEALNNAEDALPLLNLVIQRTIQITLITTALHFFRRMLRRISLRTAIIS